MLINIERAGDKRMDHDLFISAQCGNRYQHVHWNLSLNMGQSFFILSMKEQSTGNGCPERLPHLLLGRY